MRKRLRLLSVATAVSEAGEEGIIDGYLLNGVNINVLISLAAALVLAAGLFMVMADILHIPKRKMILAARNIGRSAEVKTGKLDELLEGLMIKISCRLPISDYRKEQLKKDLETAGDNRSPEEYIATAIVKSALVAVMAVPFLFILQPMSAVILVMAIVTYRNEINKVKQAVSDRRMAIEKELPRLVANIEKMLMHSRDVLSMLEGYAQIAGPELRKELMVTVADMRTGNYEIALARLESRVGSSYMSDVTRGLIGVMHGDDTSAYWALLAIKFADYQRTLLKDKAAGIPGKVRRLSVSLLVCFMMIYMVVIGMTLVSSLVEIF